MRVFKQERQLEIWIRRGDTYEQFKTYPICAYSGGLGPKLREGDHQSPEGFYKKSRKRRPCGSRPVILSCGRSKAGCPRHVPSAASAAAFEWHRVVDERIVRDWVPFSSLS